jgi:pimeloyl-ACP methyl ester carboxylesterase
MKKILTLFPFILLSFHLFGQKIIEMTMQESLTKAEIDARLGAFTVKHGIETYKILYETADTDGSLDTASGLLVLPVQESETLNFPFLAYQHGTASSREAVPSNQENGERLLIYFFAGQGYNVTAADYLGLGASTRKVHPYLHADTEASAAIDLVKAAKAYLEEEKISYSKQLFISGYSQGGHAAMAMHKTLATNPIAGLEVTASSPMSGIYNMDGELIKASLSEAVYQYPSYLVWIILSYQSVYGNIYQDLDEVFKEAYVKEIDGFEKDIITRGELNGLLVTELEKNHDASIPRYLLKENFIEAFENDPESPLRIALQKNNLYDWVPATPTRMMYCTADDQVAFTNSTFTDSIMNANGAADVMSMDVNPSANHGGCVVPATLATFIFFEGFANRSSIVSSNKTLNTALQFNIQPNPANQYLSLNFNQVDHQQHSYKVRIMDMAGIIHQERTLNNLQNIQFQLNEISSGLYIIQVESEKGFWTEKFIVNKY